MDIGWASLHQSVDTVISLLYSRPHLLKTSPTPSSHTGELVLRCDVRGDTRSTSHHSVFFPSCSLLCVCPPFSRLRLPRTLTRHKRVLSECVISYCSTLVGLKWKALKVELYPRHERVLVIFPSGIVSSRLPPVIILFHFSHAYRAREEQVSRVLPCWTLILILPWKGMWRSQSFQNLEDLRSQPDYCCTTHVC